MDSTLPYCSTKNFIGFPCAHRQHRHGGVCAHIHGYSRSFHYVFGADSLDACGFVVDFGKLRLLKTWLEDRFDHTLLINGDDPLMPQFRELADAGAAKLVLPPYGVATEGCARWGAELAQDLLDSDPDTRKRRCVVLACECKENEKNSGIYYCP